MAIFSRAFRWFSQYGPARFRSYSVVLGSIAVAATAGVFLFSVAPAADAALAPWTTVSSPNVGAPIANGLLYGVSCSGSTACVAVGSYFNGNASESGAFQTLVESWNGSAWTAIGAPNASTQTNELSAVSCSGPNFCAAVGYYIDAGGNYNTLIEAWNGSSWAIVPSPNASTQNYLQGVSCTSATLCAAVGYYINGGGNSNTLIERRNGSIWAIVASPNPSTQTNELSGVSCRGPKFCVAVGSLIESWNGSAWTIANAPRGAVGVSCRSRSACMAVGSYNKGSNTQTSTESWNGSTWTVVPSPNASPVQNGLESVSCGGRAACVAVGSCSNGSNIQTLIESWNGSSWTIVPSPNASPQTNRLSGVSCGARADCLAVGSYYDGSYFNGNVPRTLVEGSIGHSHHSQGRN